MQENERRVFEALSDPQWDWRTLAGLERATSLPRSEILEILCRHDSEIEAETVPEHGMVFRLKGREQQISWMEKTLDYISLGAR